MNKVKFRWGEETYTLCVTKDDCWLEDRPSGELNSLSTLVSEISSGLSCKYQSMIGILICKLDTTVIRSVNHIALRPWIDGVERATIDGQRTSRWATGSAKRETIYC